jgi:hypothetical protein
MTVAHHQHPAVGELDFDACALLGDECFAFAEEIAGVQLAQPSGRIERKHFARHGSDGGDVRTGGHQIKPGPLCDTGMIALNAARSYVKISESCTEIISDSCYGAYSQTLAVRALVLAL